MLSIKTLLKYENSFLRKKEGESSGESLGGAALTSTDVVVQLILRWNIQKFLVIRSIWRF